MDTAKVTLRGKNLSLNLALNPYTRKEEKSQINYLSSHWENTGKEEPNISKASRRKEIIKIKTEINETENIKIIETIKQRADSLEKVIKLTTL